MNNTKNKNEKKENDCYRHSCGEARAGPAVI